MARPNHSGEGRSPCSVLEELIRDERQLAPDFCALCFFAVPVVLVYGRPEVVRIEAQQHGLWDACMRNLCVPRTASEKAVLRQRLQHSIDACSDNRVADGSHKVWKPWDRPVSDALDLFNMLLCVCLDYCLYGLITSDGNLPPAIRAQNPNKKFRSANGAWPIRLDQLLPYGPERTVEALVDACCAFTDTTALRVLHAVLRLARPRVWGATLSPENRRRLIWYLVILILGGISNSPEHVAIISALTPAGQSVPPGIMDKDWIRSEDTCHDVVSFLTTIDSGPYHYEDDAMLFIFTDFITLQRVFLIAKEHYRVNVPFERACTIFNGYIYTIRAMDAGPLPYQELCRRVEHSPRSPGVILMIRFGLWTLYSQRCCAVPQCRRTMLDFEDEGGKPLAWCARCKLVRYCSRECQRADWAAGHRRLCPLFVKFHDLDKPASEVNESVDNAGYFRAIQQSAATDEDLVALGLWALTRGHRIQFTLICEVLRPDCYDRIVAGAAREPARPPDGDTHPQAHQPADIGSGNPEVPTPGNMV